MREAARNHTPPDLKALKKRAERALSEAAEAGQVLADLIRRGTHLRNRIDGIHHHGTPAFITLVEDADSPGF